MVKNLSLIAIVLFFSCLGIKALFHPGLFTAHDIWHQVARLYYFHQSILEGQFPPYWISNLAKGYGYPLFTFSYWLPWIVGEMFLRIGLNIETAIKALFITAYISSGLSMYIFILKTIQSVKGALVASILYLWVPYHFLITFVGASMGIAFIFPLLPILLLGVQKISLKERYGIPITAISLTGVILSHSMHLFFTAPVIISFIIWKFLELPINARKSFVINTATGLITGLLISSAYLLPAFFYNNQTRIRFETGFSELYKRNFIDIEQLIYSQWGYGPIVNNAKEKAIAFQLGFAQWASIVLLICFLIIRKIPKNLRILSVIILATFLLIVLGMLDISQPVWALLEKFFLLDYPFRLLISLVFLASLASAIVIKSLEKNLSLLVAILIILIALYTNRNHVRVNLYTKIPLSDYVSSEITTNSFHEYLPKKADSKLLNTENLISPSNFKLLNYKQNTRLLSFQVNATQSAIISVKQFYFPGQTLFIDGKKSTFLIDNQGRISFTVPTGNHFVKVIYQDTKLITVGKILSLCGLFIIFSQIYWKKDLFKKRAFKNSPSV